MTRFRINLSCEITQALYLFSHQSFVNHIVINDIIYCARKTGSPLFYVCIYKYTIRTKVSRHRCTTMQNDALFRFSFCSFIILTTTNPMQTQQDRHNKSCGISTKTLILQYFTFFIHIFDSIFIFILFPLSL